MGRLSKKWSCTAKKATECPLHKNQVTLVDGDHVSMASFQETPQPRTFAPSKEDVLQNLQYFFGAPVSPEKLKDYSEHHAMTCAPTGPQTPNRQSQR